MEGARGGSRRGATGLKVRAVLRGRGAAMTNAEMRGLLERLIRMPTDVTEAEQARQLAQLAAAEGAAVALDEVLPGRVTLRAVFDGFAPGKTWLFEAHGDTVPGVVPCRYDAATGRLYGRGACDTKASFVAMLAAILRARAKRTLAGRVHLVATCCEESGGEGAQVLMASGLRPDCAVVGEPTRLEIVRAHKGAWRTRITAHGRAAHSSVPQHGVNAILAMTEIIRVLQDEFAGELARVSHPVLGQPTVSVGTIRGGRAANIVPDACEIEVDWRLVPETPAAPLLQRLRQRFPAATVEPYEYYPPFFEPDSSPALEAVRRAVRAVTGQPAVLAGAPWAANAGIFQEAAGVPCVIFGPGDIAQAHTAEEFVEWAQVETAALVYESLLAG